MSRVFTDTPVTQAIEEEHAKKKTNSKARKNIMFSGAQKSNPDNSKKKEQNTAIKHISSSDESDSEPVINLLFDNESIDDENDDLERQIIRFPTAEQLDEDDPILVMFPGKKSVRYYVDSVIKANFDDDEVETSFMQSKLSADGRKVFAFPDHEDSCSHLVKDIVMKLPWPTTGTTSRAVPTFDFHCPALDAYSIE